MGQKFIVGTNYSFQHSLNLNLPIFTGGARLFNYNIQKSLKKSLAEELKGKEEETVFIALQSYFGVMLARSIFEAAKEAVEVSRANLIQVEKLYNVGNAKEFDLQRAKAQYYSTLPQLESALSSKHLSTQQLKLALNINLNDSLVVMDSLKLSSFLQAYENKTLEELIFISKQNRSDLKSLEYKLEVTEEGEKIALGQFTPTVAITASIQHQAQLDNSKVMWSDYIRSKSLMLSVNFPIFQGGQRVLDYQLAKIRTDQMKIGSNTANDQASIDVERNFYVYQESLKNIKSYEEALKQSKESLRLSNLLYLEGMSTQLDVLNAQLLYSSSRTQYLQAIFNNNVNQLALLKSIGLLNKIWE
jgi:outer membrane protein TolC